MTGQPARNGRTPSRLDGHLRRRQLEGDAQDRDPGSRFPLRDRSGLSEEVTEHEYAEGKLEEHGEGEPMERKRAMRRLPPAVIITLVLSLVVASVLAACGAKSQTSESGESNADAGPERSEKEAKILSAMSAGPKEIAQDARIVDYPKEAGQPLIELREGTNEWTCFPDWEATPGEDPQCLDETWMRWFEAFSAGRDPNIEAPGMAYMLQGGSRSEERRVGK